MEAPGARWGRHALGSPWLRRVPDLKRDRAASVDSCFTKVTGAKTEELQPPPDGACLNLLAVPSSGAVRSRSVDIVLPTEEQARYKALALAGPAGSAGQQGGGGSGGGPVAHLAPGIIRGFLSTALPCSQTTPTTAVELGTWPAMVSS
uniref:Uncharacterized protein n=1 Tax=Anopheles coluzzii TaxID=1518534 RepID=A0A8W7PLP7_ANOCL